MYTANYPEKRTFEKFDNEHYMVYLNEEPVTYTLTSSLGLANPDPETEADTVEEINGFSYTGDQMDGGTLIPATEATYDAFVSGLIRVKYSADEVEAMQANMLEAVRDKKHPRAAEFTQRWEEFQDYREKCKENAKKVLNL